MNGVVNGSLKHDLEDKQDPAVVKRPNNAEALAENREATKSEPPSSNALSSLQQQVVEQKQSSEPAQPIPTAVPAPVPAPVAQHPQPEIANSQSQQSTPQPVLTTPLQTTEDKPANGGLPKPAEGNPNHVVSNPVAISKGVSPKDESKPAQDSPREALHPVNNNANSNPANLPSNIDFSKSKTETVNNDDEDEEEEEKKNEPVEPPMRKVEEDENYDDE